MRSTRALAGLAVLAACGGGPSDGPGGPAVNAFTGTVAVTSALPAGTTTCQGTNQVVTFLPSGAGTDLHSVSVAGGGCVLFHNGDAAPHRPAARSADPGCAGLNAPAVLAAGADHLAGPLGGAGPQACDWQDLNNPPGGGGGGGGY